MGYCHGTVDFQVGARAADIVPLVFRKGPFPATSRVGGSIVSPQIALREVDLLRGAHREEAADSACGSVYPIRAVGVFAYPVGGNAVVARGPGGVGVGDKDAAGGNTIHPVLSVSIRSSLIDFGSGKAGDAVQAGAVSEHVGVAVVGQRGGGQYGGHGQVVAALEHAVVALLGQRGGGQLRGHGQGGAVEHHEVALVGQIGGRQFSSRGQAKAAREHTTIAFVGQRGGG